MQRQVSRQALEMSLAAGPALGSEGCAAGNKKNAVRRKLKINGNMSNMCIKYMMRKKMNYIMQ